MCTSEQNEAIARSRQALAVAGNFDQALVAAIEVGAVEYQSGLHLGIPSECESPSGCIAVEILQQEAVGASITAQEFLSHKLNDHPGKPCHRRCSKSPDPELMLTAEEYASLAEASAPDGHKSSVKPETW